MVIKTASPGVYVQELDLTRGVVDPGTQNVAFLAGPFQRGPVDTIIKINSQVELREIFGKPTDENYEYWNTVDTFLEYSGQCYVVRCDDAVGDRIDEGTLDGLGEHQQKMRNATDSYVFDHTRNSYNVIDQSKASSSVYVKSFDDYETHHNSLVALGGKFLSRNPGQWANGLGVAVIDRGADYQVRLKSTAAALSVDSLLIINGGVASSAFDRVLYGGEADSVDGAVQPADIAPTQAARRSFNKDVIVGTRLVQYAKVSTMEELAFSEIKDLEIAEAGDGFVCAVGDRCQTIDNLTMIPEVPTKALGVKSGLLLDLFVDPSTDKVVSARVSLRGASAPDGYEEGDVVETDFPAATTQAQIRIETIAPIVGTVVRIGNDTDGVIGTIMSVENNIITLANVVHPDGTFGMGQPGDKIVDPYLEGAILGEIKEYAVLGHYLLYKVDAERTISVIWEPQEYTREEGASWLWPGRPFDGETVYGTKVAMTVNGVPIQEEGSTPTNPIYATLEGPATLTPSTGDVIVWNSLKERWQQKYIPKINDMIYDSYVDPNEEAVVVVPFTIFDAYDWYSQQVAFEGIPWVQFGPRPGTSAHAQELGCDNDECNIIVYDALGDYETVGGEAPQKGRVIEQYIQASKLKGALTVEGENNFYKDLINRDSRIIISNLPLNVIDSAEEVDPDLNINTLNDGRAYPDTVISFGTRCAYLQPRYGTINFDDPASMSTLNSTTGVRDLVITTAGDGFTPTANLVRMDTLSQNGTGLKVDVTTDSAGQVIAVRPSRGFGGSGYQYGDLVSLPSMTEGGAVAVFTVRKLSADPSAPYLLLGGEDQLTASLGELQHAYSKVIAENLSDLDYILQGPAYDSSFANEVDLKNLKDNDRINQPVYAESVYQRRVSYAIAKSNYLISIADELKTAIACISPPRNAALDPIDSNEITMRIIEWAGRISSSSYAVMDSGYKYTYDRFRDKFMYIPLNGDIAGCMTRTALVSQPFFSPGGMVRGQIKNVVKLGYDPSKNNRDLLYTARVNPVCTFPGEGVVLYGDKTCLGYTSAFTRINVRRLFIYCERAIAKFAREVLFEFNDTPTRLNFVNTVTPFMTDVVSKRGATDFLIVCDSSNNTPDVIDRNEFVADIYIKPNRSINFVQLTFVATKTGVSFSEAVATNRRISSN